jgi:hypothetical protein
MRFAPVAALCGALVALPWLSAPTLATIPQSRCTLGLSLSFDMSGSIYAEQMKLIREGTAAALMNPYVKDALQAKGTFVQVFGWSETQHLVADWTEIRGPEDVVRLAETVLQGPAVGSGSTFIGAALRFAKKQFERLDCDRNVLDVLTDGADFQGIPSGVFNPDTDTVNVLWVAGQPRNAWAVEQVRFGYASFVLAIGGYEEIEKAMARKIVQELM